MRTLNDGTLTHGYPVTFQAACPDKIVRDGAVITFTPGSVPMQQPTGSPTERAYNIVLGQVDALMADVFRSAHMNWRALPLMNDGAREYLFRDNSSFVE